MMTTCLIDVSHWNGLPDFGAIAGSGIAAVIAKAGQGSASVDPMWATYAKNIRAVGLPGGKSLLLGAYSFLDGGDGVKQADHLIDIVDDPSVPLFLDAERNSSSQATVAIVATAAQRIYGRLGVWPTIYSGRYGPTGDGKGLPNIILSKCPLWLAAYVANPVCPPGWSAWSLWQYTDKASIHGMPAPCDASKFAGSLDEFRAWWGSLTTVAQKPPVTAPEKPGPIPAANPVDLIKQAQRALGFAGDGVDGDPGPATRQKLREWRAAHPGA